MQQKRNIQLLILLISLSLLIAFLFFLSNNYSSDIDKTLFKVSDQNKIDRIILASQKGKLELTFDGSKWMINQKYEADPQLVTVFFASLLQVEPKRRITGLQKDSITSRLKNEGIRVSLWEDKNLEKEFTIVGNDQKTATYFQLDNDAPYFVSIPGYRVYVASIFELTESEWRNKRVFNFNWQNFKRLKVNFSEHPTQGFTISLANGLFGIEEVTVADTTKLSSYLESIFNLQAERILTEKEAAIYDSLLATSPNFDLVIEDISKKKFELKLFSSASKSTLVLATMNNDERILLQPGAVFNILRKRDYFVFK